MRLLCGAALFFFALPSAKAASRESVSFDFAWRHRQGLHHAPAPPGPPPTPAPCAPDTFKYNMSGGSCSGLTKNANADASAAKCQAACCAQSECVVWQWEAGSGAKGCWMGHAECSASGKGSKGPWIGGSRVEHPGGASPGGGNVPDPGPHPPEAGASYDDSAWEKVQVPHDSIISGIPSQAACPGGCSGRSYLPRDVSWCESSAAALLPRLSRVSRSALHRPQGVHDPVRLGRLLDLARVRRRFPRDDRVPQRPEHLLALLRLHLLRGAAGQRDCAQARGAEEHAGALRGPGGRRGGRRAQGERLVVR